MTADDRLALIRIKIERAYKHLDELEYVIGLSSDEIHFNVVGMNFDSQTGKRFLATQPLIFNDETIPAIAGDAVHNTRCALDHLTFHLVQVGGGRNTTKFKWNDVRFPIFPTFESYESGKTRKIDGMRPEAIKAIDALKPYKDGNDALWLLNKLDNADKHSFILSIGSYQLLMGSGVILQAEEPFFTSIGSPKPKQDVNLLTDEPLIKPAVGHSNALLPTLHQLAELVGNIVREFGPLLE
jgi:hypothetical protein